MLGSRISGLVGVGQPGLPESRVRAARLVVNIAAGATEEHMVTFPSAFVDLNYTVVAQIESTEGTLGSSLRLRRISARTVSDVSVVITNDDGLNALSGTIHVLAVHD